MAVQSDTSRIQYTGNNSTTTSYAVPFVFLENSHLKATARSAAGVDTAVTLTNHAGAGNQNGGTVRTAVPVPATSTLTIYRDVPITQTTSYAEGGDFPAASHERALDKLTQIDQQTDRKVGSTLRLSETNQIPPLQLPVASGQHVLATSGNGTTPSFQSLASLAIGPVTAAGTTTPRNVQDRFANVFNVRDFGAVGDGIADDRNAFQAAFDAANTAGGGIVYMPMGRYRKSDTANNLWRIYSNTSLVGEGDQSVIFFDDRSTQARNGNDMIITDPSGESTNIEFRNFKVEGTLLTELTVTNAKQCFTGDRINGLRFENITMVGLRYMATAFNRVKNGLFTSNRLEYIGADGLRATSSHNLVFSNNTLKAVCDDCIVASTYNVDIPPAGGTVITNNTIEASQGIKVLGAKELVVANNVMRRCLRNPIHVEMTDNTEGQTNLLSINITGNTICDSFGNRGTNSAIYCFYNGGRSKQAMAQQAGVSVSPYEYNYLTNINNGTTVKSGVFGVNITNNVISRTLGDVAQYSNFGYGQLFDRTNAGFWSNPAVNFSSQLVHGIIFGSGVNGLNICDNIISGTTFTGINLVNTLTTNIIDFNNTTIARNTLIDVVGYGVFCNTSGSGVGASHIVIKDNTFDIDPFFRNPNHSANNTWTALSGCAGIVNLFLTGLYASNNIFKNCASTGLEGPPVIYPSGPNFIYADFTAGGPNDSGTNYGVRFIPEFRSNVVIPIVGDPTAANYGQIRNTIVTTSFTPPSSGHYIRGAFVQNADPAVLGTSPNKYTVSGWWRLTTGSAHVLNTDWIEVRTPTGT